MWAPELLRIDADERVDDMLRRKSDMTRNLRKFFLGATAKSGALALAFGLAFAGAAPTQADAQSGFARGGCVSGASGSGCAGGAGRINEDGSGGRFGGVAASGENGSFGSAGGFSRSEDGSVEGGRVTGAQGANGAYSGQTAYGDGSLDRSSRWSNDDGAVDVQSSWTIGEGGQRTLTCYDASGVVVACPN